MIKFHLYSLKLSAKVKIAMQCFEIFCGGKALLVARFHCLHNAD